MSRKDIDMAFGERIGISRKPGETDAALQMRIENAKARAIERQEEIDDLKHNATVEKTKNEINEAKAEAERLKVGGQGQQPQGFEVKGGVDFGTFNLQAIMKEAEDARKKVEEEMRDQLASTGQINEQLREQLHQAQLRELETRLSIQIAQAKSGNQSVSLPEQIEAIKQTAASIGMTLGPHDTSSTVNMELERLRHDHELEVEKIKDARAEADRRWELDKMRYEDERQERRDQVQAAAKKQEMWANWPAQIGAAIVQAVRESGGTIKGPEFIEEEAARTAPRANKINSAPTSYHIEMSPGESGSIRCPDCEELMVVGENATRAVCPECELSIPVTRVKESA